MIQRGSCLILAGVFPLEAFAASIPDQLMVEMPQISAFTFGGLVHHLPGPPSTDTDCNPWPGLGWQQAKLEPLLLIVLDQADGVIRHKAANRTAGLDEQDNGSIWSQDES